MMHACLTYRARFYALATLSILFAFFVSGGIASPGLTRAHQFEEWQLVDRNDIMVLVGWAILLIGILAMSFATDYRDPRTREIEAELIVSGLITALCGMAVIIRYGLKAKP